MSYPSDNPHGEGPSRITSPLMNGDEVEYKEAEEVEEELSQVK